MVTQCYLGNNEFGFERGTKEYRIETSVDLDSWQQGAYGTLPSARGSTPLERFEFTVGKRQAEWVEVGLSVRPARYVRFTVLTYYGKGAGLNAMAIYARKRERASRPSHVVLDTVDEIDRFESKLSETIVSLTQKPLSIDCALFAQALRAIHSHITQSLHLLISCGVTQATKAKGGRDLMDLFKRYLTKSLKVRRGTKDTEILSNDNFNTFSEAKNEDDSERSNLADVDGHNGSGNDDDREAKIVDDVKRELKVSNNYISPSNNTSSHIYTNEQHDLYISNIIFIGSALFRDILVDFARQRATPYSDRFHIEARTKTLRNLARVLTTRRTMRPKLGFQSSQPRADMGHRFCELTVEAAMQCDVCLGLMWVLEHAARCQQCGLFCHYRCMTSLPLRLCGTLDFRGSIPPPGPFGVDLFTLAKQERRQVPRIVEECILSISTAGVGNRCIAEVYTRPRSATAVAEWRKQIEHGNFEVIGRESAAASAILKHFLAELPHPVLPVSLHKAFTDLLLIDDPKSR